MSQTRQDIREAFLVGVLQHIAQMKTISAAGVRIRAIARAGVVRHQDMLFADMQSKVLEKMDQTDAKQPDG